MELPTQSPPVRREMLTSQDGLKEGEGVEAAQSACDRLVGTAQQICYALEYGIST